ncbi:MULTISPECIES: cytochrome c family protein [Azospirillaceae]|uniref:c-type cytochrome n=1 Tax=Azospirillaceae TaxID=2829815 RepID=UPI000B6DF3FD|nr:MULTISPECIES: cytochrome c family protein [Azospirillaceae]MDG5495561.1 cytochrome c family protein [Niveispirillum sp. BGYR6]SNR88418.1 cytochrome c [Azospirillum sp. RU38E]SNS04587.1 cytochrome c [Azospirillum sp. RU37A]
MRTPARMMITALTTALALTAGITAAQAAGDPAKGEKVFARCKVCHAVEANAPKKVGPPLHGLFGRHTASIEGFAYSDALKKADFVWSQDKLDQWLTKPQAFLPGNKMAFPGVPNPEDRADLIAYLEQATK